MANHHEITDDQITKLAGLADGFNDLQRKIDEELKNTGFRASTRKELVEPRLEGSLVDKSEVELRRMYDLFIVYYDYITDLIVNYETQVKTVRGKVEAVKNTLTIEAAGLKTLSNADLRKAWVATHPIYLQVEGDYMYIRQVYDAQMERRKKLSATMKRIYQELFMRNPALQRTAPGKDTSGVSTDPRQARNERKARTFNRFTARGGQ